MARLTVTIFGDGHVADQALARELDRRGARTHIVTVATGWVPSATLVIVRSETVSGRAAAETMDAAAVVDGVITCELGGVPPRIPPDAPPTSSTPGRHLSLVHHPPIDEQPADDHAARDGEISPDDFATSVVDELAAMADIA